MLLKNKSNLVLVQNSFLQELDKLKSVPSEIYTLEPSCVLVWSSAVEQMVEKYKDKVRNINSDIQKCFGSDRLTSNYLFGLIRFFGLRSIWSDKIADTRCPDEIEQPDDYNAIFFGDTEHHPQTNSHTVTHSGRKFKFSFENDTVEIASNCFSGYSKDIVVNGIILNLDTDFGIVRDFILPKLLSALMPYCIEALKSQALSSVTKFCCTKSSQIQKRREGLSSFTQNN